MAGGMHGGGVHSRGACMARGHVWQGACIAGGMHGRGHAWQGDLCGRGHAWQGGMCDRGACVARGVHGRGHAWQGACVACPPGRYYEIRSMSGRYASYWSAFLL